MGSSGAAADNTVNGNPTTVNPGSSYNHEINVDSRNRNNTIKNVKLSTPAVATSKDSSSATSWFPIPRRLPLVQERRPCQNSSSLIVDSSKTKETATRREPHPTSSPPGDQNHNGGGNWWNRTLANILHSLSGRFTILAAANLSQEVVIVASDAIDLHNSRSISNSSVRGGTILKPISVSGVETDNIGENPSKLSKMKEDKAVEVFLKSLVSGGVAGMCAKTAVAPLDRIKILLQAHSKHYSHLGVFSGLRGIVEKERFLALYKGNGAQMVRIFPYAATQFTSFETYKKLFGENSHIGRFAAGSCAGVTAVALTYPLDTIRARLAFQVSGEHLYNGIVQCATHIFREEGGIRALYRGFTPTICGMIPYAGLSFYCFESFKFFCMKYFPGITCKQHLTNTGGLVLLLPFKLLCGGVAGAVAQTVSYPLDVTRRRMQLAMMNENTKKFGMGMVSTLKIIYQENGVSRGLYRGMSINYLRAIPMVAVSFSTYETVKQFLNLDTGLPMKTG